MKKRRQSRPSGKWSKADVIMTLMLIVQILQLILDHWSV